MEVVHDDDCVNKLGQIPLPYEANPEHPAQVRQPQPEQKADSSQPSKKKRKLAGFRKAPQAPRRFKSPYIIFSISRMAEYKKSLLKGSVQVTSISRRIAQEWKSLPKEERQKWDQIALQDKMRYNAEKSLYTGPWQVPSKRSRKDPTAPKRPPSAFLFYCQSKRRTLKQEHPELKNTDISKLLGKRWKAAPEEERRPHVEREQRDRQVYKTKIAEWRKQRALEESEARKQRQIIAEQYMKWGGTYPTSTGHPQSAKHHHGPGFPAPPLAPAWGIPMALTVPSYPAVAAVGAPPQSNEPSMMSQPKGFSKATRSEFGRDTAPTGGTKVENVAPASPPAAANDKKRYDPAVGRYLSPSQALDGTLSNMNLGPFREGPPSSAFLAMNPYDMSDQQVPDDTFLFPPFLQGDSRYDPPLPTLDPSHLVNEG